MKNKFSDDTLNRDGLPKHNQESAEKGKIKLLDVVALTQDVPEHNLKRGEVGTIVEILSNGEAFEVKFSDDNGQMYKCLSFPASQLEVFHQEPIKADSKRQATDSIEGYRYQILHSVNAWLDLADNDILYLEIAEDFDIESDGTFTATQVKHTQDNITLRSQQVIDGINNYWELRTNNRDRRVKFRLLTKSKIVEEQGDSLGMDKPGLEVWSRCSGDEAAIQKISEFLQTDGKISEEVNGFLKVSSPQKIYEQLIEPITWETDSKPVSFVDQSINEKLVHHGDRHGISPSAAKKVFYPLIDEAWKVAGQPENRKLTRLRFLEIFEEETKRLVPEQYLQHMEMLVAMRGAVGTGFTGGSSDITIQSSLHIQTDIPLLFLNVVVPRTELLTRIQDKLQSDGIAIIQGGVDKGKTILAKLTANSIDGDWFWLKFTNKEASQIAQDLRQLADAVSNRSAQVNVILDDLNLQPQQLQEYEEDLGVVAYRVLERGAKLLITSQYNPPNNLIRSLGLSSSIVVHVPNFTIPEIEQFATEMGCPAEHAKTWSGWVQVHTNGHPRLVHARLTQLQQEDWKYQGKIESLLQTPQEVVKEREEARQILMGLSENQRKLLYRLSLLTEFRRDYSLNIGEIPEAIPYPGDVFSQLVGPWIDQVSENYYTISPLLKNAANEVWSKSKINDLHAEVANAILKANNLTIIEAGSVLLHSIRGVNKKGVIAVIASLMTASDDNWKMVSQALSWVTYIKTNPSKELFPGDTFANYCFRSLQYRIAVEVEPEFAPKILEIWDKETKPHEPNQPDPFSRIMLTTQVLMYHQVLLPAKQMVAYLKEIIDIKNNDKEVWETYLNSMGELEEHGTNKSSLFSILFSFVYTRPPVDAPFLSDLIEALDELDPKDRTLLLTDFEDDNVEPRILIDGVWLAEANLENPDWTRCLEVFDKVIERTIAWGYPHIAAASVKGKAIIHDEKLNDSDTAHEVLQDIASEVGRLPVIEEEQAMVYFRQEHYREALNIYERILPEWNPPSERLSIGPLEEYRRAAICAAYLDDWKKAACFFEEGADKTQKIENTERYIGLYADAGFAQFKAGNMLESIKLLNLALQNFGRLPQDNTDLNYFTLKKRLGHTIGWIASPESEDFEEPPIGFCSDSETNEKFLDLPDFPMGYFWSTLAKIEYKLGHGKKVVDRALQITDQDADIVSISSLFFLKTQHDFRNKTFDELPRRIQELSNVCDSIKKHIQSGKGIEDDEIASIPIATIPNFTSVENITVMLVASLLVQFPTGMDIRKILATWRTNASELLIKDKVLIALNLIESTLFGDQNNALRVMKTQDSKPEEQLAAALKIIHNTETSSENLFHAHVLIAPYLVSSLIWIDSFGTGLAELLSAQWLEKIKFRATLKTPMITAPQIEQACSSSETGKKKIGQILLVVHQAVSIRVAPETLQQLRSWIDNPR